MKVELKSFTQDALNLLLSTKNTRLGFSSDPSTWPDDKKQEHLEYMLDTIKSSWEFVDYVFEISGVSRVFTHQLVRTRAGSYAQESQRTVDVSMNEILEPDFTTEDADFIAALWRNSVSGSMCIYKKMIKHGVPVQDARGILPMNTTTSIFCKFNLRTLSEMAKTRLCVRTQGEYQDVFRAMRDEVLKVHPWAEDFLQVHCVSTGTCAFPRYGKTSCKFYDPRMDLTSVKADTKSKFWSDRQVAIPVAVEGKTM